jgi:hypothetical protein
MARRSVRNCRSFLVILISLLMLFPVLQEMARPILLISAVASVFVAGVIVVDSGRRRVRNAATLGLVQIVLTGVAVAVPGNSFLYLCAVSVGLAVTVILIAYCIFCVLRYVLQAFAITHDQIYGGICVYLLLGFAFGCIYYLVNTLAPGCFAVNNVSVAGTRAPDLMYFSFVTLATLGYGDVTAVGKAARALAQVEALAGMLYIAVFMARLVTMYSAEREPAVFPPLDKRRSQTAGRDLT